MAYDGESLVGCEEFSDLGENSVEWSSPYASSLPEQIIVKNSENESQKGVYSDRTIEHADTTSTFLETNPKDEDVCNKRDGRWLSEEIKVSSQLSNSYTAFSAKERVPTNQTTASFHTPVQAIYERDYNLSETFTGSHKNEKCEVDTQPIKVRQLPIRIKDYGAIGNETCPKSIIIKAQNQIEVTLHGTDPITLILCGITASSEIHFKKLTVNKKEYVFV